MIKEPGEVRFAVALSVKRRPAYEHCIGGVGLSRVHFPSRFTSSDGARFRTTHGLICFDQKAFILRKVPLQSQD